MYPGTDELLAFVWQRTEDALDDAERRGDELRARFAGRSLRILADIRAALDQDTSIGELMATRFLRRMAQDHCDHPGYRPEWNLDDR